MAVWYCPEASPAPQHSDRCTTLFNFKAGLKSAVAPAYLLGGQLERAQQGR